jgi:hypothetical protein
MNSIKRISILIISILIVSSKLILAQNNPDESEMQTLFGNKKYHFTGMGGLQVGYSKFNGKDAILVGGRGGVVINHNLALGIAGWGFASIPVYNNIGETGQLGYLEGGYGGLLVEPIFMSKRIVHLSMPIIIGAGDLMYLRKVNRNMSDLSNMIDSDPFFIVEPGIELEVNLLRFMRVAAGASYHWSPNLNLISTPSNPFNGLTASIALKFGKF